MDLPMPDLGTSAGWHLSAPSSTFCYQLQVLSQASLGYSRVCSTPFQFHAMKSPVWRVSLCPPVIQDTWRQKQQCLSPFLHNRWVLGPRVALDGYSPSAFGGSGLSRIHTAPPHHLAFEVLADMGLQMHLRGAGRCRVDFQLWFSVNGTCRCS